MKKRAGKGVWIILFLISFSILILLIGSFILETDIISIIGKLIEGKATSGTHSVSVAVTVNAPTLEIIRPLNYTYLRTTNIPLEFTSDGNDFWYNINHTNNISITGNTLLDVPEGEHVLFLYANNTLNNEAGFTTRSVVFSVNPSRINIIYGEYNGSTKGSSTDFYNYTYEELGNITALTLENTEHGKIIFSEAINLTDDENPGDNAIYLDSNVNISFNRIELNATALPNFEKAATLSLYNLTYTNPRILKDGVVCPANECTEISYSGNNLIFSVTSFTVYSAEETPGVSRPPAEVPGATGGTWGRKIAETKVPQIRIPAAVKPLFDVIVTVPLKYKALVPGEELIAQIDIVNVKAPEGVDILIDHYIRNSSDTDIWHEYETRRIEKQIIFIKEIKLPEDIEIGDYLFYTIVTYNSTTSTGGAFFEVVKEKVTPEEKLYVVAIVIALIVISIIIYYYEKQRQQMLKIIAGKVGIRELRRSGGGGESLS